MTDHDEIRQQLLELIYGLLPADEASRLAGRIGRDPELARTYAEVKEQTDLLGSAVRLTEVPLPDFAAWKKQAQEAERVERSRAMQGFVRGLQVLTALAASVLILASGAAVFFTTTAELAQAPTAFHSAPTKVRVAAAGAEASPPAIELEVSGPRVLSSEVANRFAISVRNEAAPQEETEISYNFKSPQGETIAAGKQQAVNGLARIALPADKARADLKLQVTAQQGRELAEVESPQLASAPPKTVTSLSLDRPLVRAGDTIRWRSNTLTSQTQLPVDGSVGFEIFDPNQQPVSGFVEQGETRQGVAASMWSLPTDIIAGNYSLIAKNGDGIADVTRFQVDPIAPPVWNARLDFAQDWFSPGEEVSASLQLNSQSGQPLANQKLQMRQIVQGSFVAAPQEIETSAEGLATVKLQLTGSVDPRVSQHLYFSNADQSWAFASPIPLEPQAVDVLFCPEGGTLVAGLSNRVYFHATDANGKPVELQGAVVNSRDEVVATAKTEYRGRGRFDFIPLPQQNYRLTAALGDNRIEADLPAISETALATIKVAAPVVDADQPLEVEVVSRDADQRYGLAYYNNGALVTQQFFAVPQTLKSTRVRLDVPPEIAGAGQVTLYAASEFGQITPLAERMVFRRPAQHLTIETPNLQQDYAANDQVSIDVVTKDETGQPTLAALGIAVVNENAFTHTTQASPTLVAAQLLTKRLQRPEELQDPQALMSSDAEAERELDFILATDGWRQFIKAGSNSDYGNEYSQELAYGRQAVPTEELERIEEMLPHDFGNSAAFDAEPPILILKNRISSSVVPSSSTASAPVTSAMAGSGFSMTPWLLGAAITTMLGLIGLALLHSAGSPWFWGPAIVISSLAAILIGVMAAPTTVGSSAIRNPLAMREPTVSAPTARPESSMPNDMGAEMNDGLMQPGKAGREESVAAMELSAMDVDRVQMQRQPLSAEPGDVVSPSSALPLSDNLQPMAAGSQQEEQRKLAESKPPGSAAKAAPMLKTTPENRASEKPSAMRAAGDEAAAKKEAGDAPAAPSTLLNSAMSEPTPPATPKGNALERSQIGNRPQSRYSFSDQKGKSQLGQLQQRRDNMSTMQREDDLLLRNQTLGTTEYGLRQAESQHGFKQSAAAAQQAQPMQLPSAGFGGGAPQANAGFAPAQPAAEAAPNQPPTQRLMLSRGAAQRDRTLGDDAQPSADANDKRTEKSTKDFYYRAYAYGESEKKDVGGDRNNQAAPETIYWAPLVQTDSSGQATLSFQLPPTPGKYRITIDALGEGRLGSVRHSFSTRPVSNSATPPASKKASK
ncbi:hypothetical protein [Blastopirellula marina]|uniref:Macroglobulin domain-containing protein n=1 Tax=Blastopirellula marina DSM 3645 TaxID=314230 RepID=A3ZS04_9BACT|nr:hypothetical protein [Blastopirellula marina]EAQ80926.1 hypothetical protein DSM3645_12936 [Blastopirellula marina DSM 3645]